MAFSTEPVRIALHKNARLNDVVRSTADMPFGHTDCAVPMIVARKQKMPIDAFIIYTDNETWAGRIHPAQALKTFRSTQNKPDAKLVVVGMTSTGFSIADPNDPGMVDIVGFDSNAPGLIRDFIEKGL
jgi:60 kDa SS-A/Ro ribonucleoprotein